MKIVLPSFDPSATLSGTVSNPLPGGKGRLIIRNDSGINLIFTFNSDQVRVLAQSAELVWLCESTFTFTWKQETVLLNAANVPISLVLIDAYTPDEPIPGTYPFAVPRVANVGNQVNTTGSNSVIVTGETPPNDLVKSSPIGYTHSTIDIRDDGTITVYGLDNNVEKLLFQIAPSASVAVKIALLSAALGSAGQLTIDESGNLVTTGTASTGALTATGITTTGTVTAGVLKGDGASGTDLSVGSAAQMTVDASGNLVTTGTADVGNLTMTKITSSDAGKVSTDGAGKFTASKLSSDGGTVATDGSGNATVVKLTANAASGNALVAGSSGQLTIDNAGNLSSTGSVHAYDAIYVNSATVETVNDHFGFPTSKVDGKIIRTGITFAGTGAGTYTHGWGGLQDTGSLTPLWCGITENVVGNTMTVGIDTLGSTTVHVDVGVNGTAWLGIVFRT